MRFTVVTPVYNNSLTLEATAKTVFAQTFSDWEWVIVNDGSKDDSAEICDRLAKENPKVRVFHQPNGGVSVARNNAISYAKGDYIVPIDADDAFEPWALEYLDSLISKFPDVETIQTPCKEVKSKSEKGKSAEVKNLEDENSSLFHLSPLLFTSLRLLTGPEAFHELFVDPKTRRQEWQPWRFTYRRDCAPHYTPGVIHEDIDTMPLYLRSRSRVIISPIPYYIYTVAREGSATQFFTARRTRDMLNIMPHLWECEEFRPMLEWNLWGYYRATEKLEGAERKELMARFREHPEYLGLSRSDVGRHPGLDFARIAAMFLVVLQHVVLLGGLANDGMGGLHKFQARFLESFSQCCIGIFGLLSGWLLWENLKFKIENSKFKIENLKFKTGNEESRGGIVKLWNLRKFGSLWLQVFSTGLLVLALCWISSLIPHPSSLFPSPSWCDWKRALLPLWMDEYWYFTGYLFVFLSAPLLAFIAGRPWAKYLAIGLFLATCGVAAFPGGDAALPLDGGYSAAWLVLLAFWGMVLRNEECRIENVELWVKRKIRLPPLYILHFTFFIFFVAITAGQRFAMASVPAMKEFFADEWTLAHYTSPTVVLASAAFLLGCSRLDFGKRLHKLVYAVAPCAFGVYLLHVQPFFFVNYIKGHLTFLDSLPDVLFGAGAVALAGAIFAVCIAIEKLRKRIFRV